MFRKKHNSANDIYNLFENLEIINEEQLKNLYIKIISKGEEQTYKEVYNKRPLYDKELLEYALAYGRSNILEHILNQCNILTNDYDPFMLENCEPDITSDVYDNSWWSNDEYERSIVNKKGINHSKCFELLKQYGKQIDVSSVKEWLVLSNSQIKYYNGTYFPLLKDIISELLKNKKIEINITNVINVMESVNVDVNLLLKIIINTFKEQEIIEQLKK